MEYVSAVIGSLHAINLFSLDLPRQLEVGEIVLKGAFVTECFYLFLPSLCARPIPFTIIDE